MIRFFDMFSGIDGFTGIARCKLGRYADKACKLAGNVVTGNVVQCPRTSSESRTQGSCGRDRG